MARITIVICASFLLLAAMFLAASMTGCFDRTAGDGPGVAGLIAPPSALTAGGSHFGVHLGNLGYASAVTDIMELGQNIQVRNEVYRDAYGWRRVKSSEWIEECQACCDPTRAPCDCSVGDSYYCSPASRQSLLVTPILFDFYVNGFSQFVTLHTDRYDDTPPASLVAAFPHGHEDVYRDYVSFVVENFNVRIKDWEIGNEYDLPTFWSGTAQEYADLLTVASNAVRSQCSDCTVGASFSAPYVAAQWYSAMASVTDAINYLDIHRTQPSFIQSGDLDAWKAACPGKEIITTETGIPDTTGFAAQDAGGSRDAQARDLVKYNTLLFAEGYNRVFWYLIDTDYGLTSTLFLHNGLINEDGVRKTAFTAYRTMIAKVDFFTSVTRLTDEVYCYSFANRNPVYAMWCDSGTCVLSVPISGRVRVTDYLGHETMRQITGSVTTSIPVYVESVPVGTSIPPGPGVD